MPHAIALAARIQTIAPFEGLRMVLVYACALALIGAGPFLPGIAW